MSKRCLLMNGAVVHKSNDYSYIYITAAIELLSPTVPDAGHGCALNYLYNSCARVKITFFEFAHSTSLLYYLSYYFFQANKRPCVFGDILCVHNTIHMRR